MNQDTLMGSQRNLGLKYGPAKLSGVVDLMFQSCTLETCGHARFLEAILNFRTPPYRRILLMEAPQESHRHSLGCELAKGCDKLFVHVASF